MPGLKDEYATMTIIGLDLDHQFLNSLFISLDQLHESPVLVDQKPGNPDRGVVDSGLGQQVLQLDFGNPSISDTGVNEVEHAPNFCDLEDQ